MCFECAQRAVDGVHASTLSHGADHVLGINRTSSERLQRSVENENTRSLTAGWSQREVPVIGSRRKASLRAVRV